MEMESFEGKSVSLTIEQLTEQWLLGEGYRIGAWMEVDDHCTESTLHDGIEETKELLQTQDIRLIPTMDNQNQPNYRRLAVFIR